MKTNKTKNTTLYVNKHKVGEINQCFVKLQNMPEKYKTIEEKRDVTLNVFSFF
jgi:hypothetical protein